MFTPMQWKRIIHGLVQSVGMVKDMVQSSVIAIYDVRMSTFKEHLCTCKTEPLI